ncbi:MAG: T9SS type A sorting domain-containing protein [Bacteroidetes bacterium]|nr:T9SS type A sorting domain-containing protein [Bacteroidota bacterium]
MSKYSQPNQGEFTVKFNAAQPDNYTIKITNALGEVVHEYTLNAFIGEHRRTINLEKISKGVYMVNIISSDKSTVKRITIN